MSNYLNPLFFTAIILLLPATTSLSLIHYHVGISVFPYSKNNPRKYEHASLRLGISFGIMDKEER
ncbi:hypothetical protein Patl1_33314 [Pistacia atlantica]|uniref:Uncharacterized protein n=1 Tax=Pistacia atlantica TaxID=434234 RepID=A0ACC0ZRI4_9ROSI|nr:hypothetical protein Patl1_33314 [Pistacia atlantica]